MPATRAETAAASAHRGIDMDEIATLKSEARVAAAKTITTAPVLSTGSVSSDCASAKAIGKRARPFERTNSMPAFATYAAGEENSSNADLQDEASNVDKSVESTLKVPASSSRSGDSRLPARSRSQRAFSSARSSCSTSSSFSSMSRSYRRLGALDIGGRRGGDSDDSEDEERNLRLRLGGCRPNSEALPTRDDCNKENIAPLRSLSERTLRMEAAAHQEDERVRRTRTIVPAPMSDRSGSVQSSATRPTQRRQFQRTVSQPTTSSSSSSSSTRSKRGRVTDSSIEPNDSLPMSTSRARLDVSSDEAESSYFSSQGTSLFDHVSSQETSPVLSRCTTPDPTASQDFGQGKYDDEIALGEDASDVETTMALDEEDTSSLSSLPGGDREYANVFVHARSLLRYGAGSEGQVIGREREKGTLYRFLQRRMGLFQHMEHSATPAGDAFAGALELDGASDSGSLYICGMPGTGKTALVKSILSDVMHQQSPDSSAAHPLSATPPTMRVIFIDCMTVQHPRELFRSILVALNEDVSMLPSGEAGQQEAERRVNAVVMDARQRLLIVLDEIDHLMRSRVHQNILYQLFSWPAKSETCSLIGIANSLDLTERFVPLLASKGAAPAVLNFRPFEAQEIIRVLSARLALLRSRYGVEEDDSAESVTPGSAETDPMTDVSTPLFAPAALELLARKISAATGDLRKALDGARLAVEAVEGEFLRAAKADSTHAQASSFTPTTAPKASPSHVLRILSTVLGSPELTKLRALGLQAKLVLLSYLVADKRAGFGLSLLGGHGTSQGGATMKRPFGSDKPAGVGASSVSLSDVETTYTAMLKNDEFATLESSEFMGVLEGLEVEGIVRFTSLGAAAPGRPSSKPVVARPVLGVAFGSGKRSNKNSLRQTKGMTLSMSHEEVLRGITTAAPASRALATMATTSCSPVVAAAIQRIWAREEHNAERAKGWEAQAAVCARVRNDELGGGRGALGI